MKSIFHHRHFRLLWDLMITAFTLHLAVYIPYHLALPASNDNLFFSGTVLLTLIFGFDIWLDYRYPYYQLDPMYKSTGRPKSRLLQNGLLFDILAALPLGLFSNSVIRLLRLAKLYKVRIILGRLRIQNLRFSQQFSLIYLVLVIFLVTHWISCGWLLIRTPDPQLSPTENYINALYWSLTTISTVGYGDIVPQNVLEKAYAIFTMLTGFAFFSLLIGQIANLLNRRDPANQHYLENTERLSQFMRYRPLPLELQEGIQEYYQYKWQKRLGLNEEEFLDTLPLHLKTQVALQMKTDILEKIPLFQEASDAFIESIALHLQAVVFTPDSYITRAGEIGEEMYFIVYGEVAVLNEEGEEISRLSEGDFFGEISLFLHRLRTASIVAETYCDMYKLSKTAFDQVITHYPYFAAKIEAIARSREKNRGQTEVD